MFDSEFGVFEFHQTCSTLFSLQMAQILYCLWNIYENTCTVMAIATIVTSSRTFCQLHWFLFLHCCNLIGLKSHCAQPHIRHQISSDWVFDFRYWLDVSKYHSFNLAKRLIFHWSHVFTWCEFAVHSSTLERSKMQNFSHELVFSVWHVHMCMNGSQKV